MRPEDTYPDWPNLPTMMFSRARQWPARPMLRFHRGGAWQGIAWGEFARRAASVARALRRHGVGPGDRVLLVSDSRPEVPVIETALMALMAVPVPAYPVNTAEDHAHLLRDSGARVAISATPALAARVDAGAALAAGLDHHFCMEDDAYAALEADPVPPDDVAAEAEAIPPGAMACLMYTSGTSGLPRGVMLPHRAILANCRGAFELVRPLKLHDETYLSFLPLSHSYEHTVGQFFLPSMGAEIVYARGIEHLAADLLATKPSILTLVPRILDVVRSRILGAMKREPAWRQRLFQRALDSGLRRIDGTATLLDRLLDPALDRLVRQRVRDRFGGRFKAAMSGGARLDPEIGRFYLAMGMTLMQGYGQTEAGPVISANPPDRVRVATVGVPLDGVELRIADDGEILVRGDLVMDGYWQQPDATASAIEDGWLRTGDVGELDVDGYLTITDRKKDIIVLSGGENVAPARVEGALMNEPAIAQAVVYGDGQSGLTGLLVAADGFDEKAVAAAVNAVNARLSITERIRRHRLVAPFTTENGLMTASHKIRRAVVIRTFRD